MDLSVGPRRLPRSGIAAILIVLCGMSWSLARPASAAARCARVSYHSAPLLKAQRVCENLGVATHGTPLGTYLFLTQSGSAGAGAGIFQDDGTLVWWVHPAARKDHDMTVVHYQGRPYIALWTGHAPKAGSYGIGDVTLYDEHYRVAGHISIGHTGGAQGIDLHEFQITPGGDALLGSYTPTRRRVNGHRETVLGYLAEKWSLVRGASGIHTGKLLFTWNSLSDVPVFDSHVPDPGANGIWDYFHGNGITEAPDGNLVVSARNTWGIYEINTHHGSRGYGHVAWQVGAKHDSRLSKPWCYQHDIAALGRGVYSLYDNGGTGPGCMPGSTQHPARGVVFGVDTSRRPVRVRLLRTYAHKPPIYTGFTGSTQILDNGDSLIDWANVPRITEYDRTGREVKMDLSLSGWSYRGLRFAWDGEPTQPPALAARRTASGTRAWASWNGSTEVAAWQVLGGPDADHLAPVDGRLAKRGFETAMTLSGHYASLAVQALNSRGDVIGTSRPIPG
jgi:hypothetical protein